MSIASGDPRDIERFVRELMSVPSFPALPAAELKSGAVYRYRAVYITDTSKPAWMDAGGTWRYADGSIV